MLSQMMNVITKFCMHFANTETSRAYRFYSE